MALANTSASYGAVTKSFHWLTALLILTLIPLGIVAHQMGERILSGAVPPDALEAYAARTVLLFSIHKTLGVLTFFVALARILWTLTQAKPGLLNAENKPEALAAETVHWLLYGSLVLVPLSGWIHHAATEGYAPIWWPFGQELPFVPKSAAVAELFGALHFLFALVLGGSILAHVAGALKHHVIDRDMTLLRMLPGKRSLPQPPAQSHSFAPLAVALVVWAAALGGGAVAGKFSHSHDHAHDQSHGAELAEVQSDWVVQEGTLAIGIVQNGAPVAGQFDDWTAQITFAEPAAPGPAGEVTVTVAIPSLSLGLLGSQAMGADFFDAANFATATFTAEIEKLDTGYVARGPLTIKGVSLPLELPFTLAIEGDTATMSGTAQVDRRDYTIGGDVTDAATLGFDVAITVDLVATKSE